MEVKYIKIYEVGNKTGSALFETKELAEQFRDEKSISGSIYLQIVERLLFKKPPLAIEGSKPLVI